MFLHILSTDHPSWLALSDSWRQPGSNIRMLLLLSWLQLIQTTQHKSSSFAHQLVRAGDVKEGFQTTSLITLERQIVATVNIGIDHRDNDQDSFERLSHHSGQAAVEVIPTKFAQSAKSSTPIPITTPITLHSQLRQDFYFMSWLLTQEESHR